MILYSTKIKGPVWTYTGVVPKSRHLLTLLTDVNDSKNSKNLSTFPIPTLLSFWLGVSFEHFCESILRYSFGGGVFLVGFIGIFQ